MAHAQPNEYPEILQDLADHVAHQYVDQGFEPEQAAKLGHEAAERIREVWGGLKIYIPKGSHYELSQRDREIWTRFSGGNTQILAREYGLSEVRIYQILEKVRKEVRRRTQPDLFGSAGTG